MMDRVEELTGRYIEGVLTNGERAELEHVLRTSSGARKTFWDLAVFHGLLREWGVQE